MATYLLTGATGFLGSHLLRALVSAGHQVVLLSRKPLDYLDHPHVRVVVGDVLDQESVQEAAKGCDGMFHCAGMVSRDPDDAKAMMSVHVDGTKRALDGAKAAGVKRVVYISTSGTVAISEDDKELPNEESPVPYGLIGRWAYYRSKLFAEEEALKRNCNEFEVISLNPSLLLGPGDVRGGSTKDILWFLQQKIPAIPPGGLSFVDVRDVADVALQAMRKGRPGQRYLLGGCNMSFADYFGRLSRLSGVEGPVLPMPRNKTLNWLGNTLYRGVQDKLNQFDGPDDTSLDQACYFWYLDSSLAERELGFAPRDPLETIADTIQDMREWDPHFSARRGDQTLRVKFHLMEGLTIFGQQAQGIAQQASGLVKDMLQSQLIS
jgi:dihydroflavonol-4-reductase